MGDLLPPRIANRAHAEPAAFKFLPFSITCDAPAGFPNASDFPIKASPLRQWPIRRLQVGNARGRQAS